VFIKLYCWSNNIFYYGATTLVAQGLLIIEDSRSHSVNTPHSIGLLDERSACRRDLNLKTRNAHKRQTSMSLTGFEPTIPGSERSPTDALDKATTGTSIKYHWVGRMKDDKMDRTQGWTNTGRQFALVTKFTKMALNIFESSVRILFRITLQAPVILGWLLDFFLVECIARVVVIGNGHKIEGC
jgi:hypothetical protein